MIQLQWIKSQAGTWLEFQTFNLATAAADGVYIIWHGGNPSKVVYVGQGDVPARLQTHRNRADIAKYANAGMLYVTWATVSAHLKDGVERFLADKWKPLIGDAHPDVVPIAVNSPWA